MRERVKTLLILCAAPALLSGCVGGSVPRRPELAQPVPPAVKALKLRVGSVSESRMGDLTSPLRGALEEALQDAGISVTSDPSAADGTLSTEIEHPALTFQAYKTTLSLKGQDGSAVDTFFFEGGSIGNNFTRTGGAFQKIADGIAYNLVAKLVSSAKVAVFAQERSEQRGASPSAEAAPVARRYSSDVDKPKFQAPENPNNFAMVVGVEKYANELPEAQFAERDAEAVKNTLIALGYPERNIKFLKGNRAGRASLEAYLEDWLPKNVKEGGTVFVYFSGHGAPDPESGQAYLVPYDGDPSFLDKTGYPLKRLYANLNALKAKRVIVALDSCFSGAGGRSVLPKGTRPLVNKIDLGAASGMGKLVVFTASAGNQISGTSEAQGHGLFTYYFLRGLNGPAAAADGSVSAKGLYDYLSPKVEDEASRDNRGQSPQLISGEDAAGIRLR